MRRLLWQRQNLFNFSRTLSLYDRASCNPVAFPCWIGRAWNKNPNKRISIHNIERISHTLFCNSFKWIPRNFMSRTSDKIIGINLLTLPSNIYIGYIINTNIPP